LIVAKELDKDSFVLSGTYFINGVLRTLSDVCKDRMFCLRALNDVLTKPYDERATFFFKEYILNRIEHVPQF
jgi:hypothetical protein